MRKFLISAALGVALASPASAATLLDYSVYSLGNYTSVNGGSTIAGRVAVAGDARINSETIGKGLSGTDAGSPTVVVGGDMSYDNSTLRYGSVYYGGSNTSGEWTQVRTPNGSVAHGQPLDFATLSRTASDYSAALAGMSQNGSFSSLHGAGTLTTGSSGLTIFNLTGSQLSSLHSLKLVGDPAGMVVINIDASDFSRNLSFDTAGFGTESVLLNFHNASNLTLGGWNLDGSILAPDALVTLRGSSILGNVVSGNFQSAGAKVGGKGYAGYQQAAGISAIPEPDSWLMMLAGFTLVGIMMRRRRRQAASVLA